MRSVIVALVCGAALAGCASAPQIPPSTAPIAVNRAAPAPPLDFAASDPCTRNYADGKEPGFEPLRDFGDLWLLCYTHFVVLHSSDTLTPVWSAERLTRTMALGADAIPRKDSFHADYASEEFARAKPSDYTNSGYNRGHMTPADDMPDASSQDETFSMANMAPQTPRHNQHLWASLEGALHVLAESQGELFIVTGPEFAPTPRRIKQKVAIPRAFFKAVYDPTARKVTVFYAANRDSASCKLISLNELEMRTGIIAFPTLGAELRGMVERWMLPDGHYKSAPDCTP